jgi:hypothetical protein
MKLSTKQFTHFDGTFYQVATIEQASGICYRGYGITVQLAIAHAFLTARKFKNSLR